MPTNTKQLTTFLRGLKAHNAKPWFDAHRPTYEALRTEFIEDIQRLILAIAAFDPAVKYEVARSAVYRINRDIRFSKNKQLYKTNFGAGIGPGGKKGALPGYHLQLDYDGTMMIAGGLYMAEPAQLDQIRTAIDRHPSKLPAILQQPTFRKMFGGLDATDALKRPPRGYAADHPAIELLKLKHFAAWTNVRIPAGDFVPVAAGMFKVLFPLIEYLRAAL